MIMKSLFSVLGIVGFVLAAASGCSDDDIDVTPDPPPSRDAGLDAAPDLELDAGEVVDAAEPGTADASPPADAASDAAASDAAVVGDAGTDGGDEGAP